MGQLRVFLFFTAFTFLIFFPIFFGKVNLNGNLLVSFYPPYGQNLPYKNTGWDQLRIYFPFYKVTLDSIRHFQAPLWNPYAFSGHPHAADFQSAGLYPLNIFGFFLPQIEFWHLLRITPTILGSFFMFFYLKNLRVDSRPRGNDKEGRASTLAALFGALTFGFSPFILTWGEEVVMTPHSIVWLPLILWGIDRFWTSQNDRKSGKKYLAIIVFTTAFSFLGGYMQTSIYMFVFIIGYSLLRFFVKSDSTQNDRVGVVAFLRLFGAFVLGTALAAVQLLPSAELFFNAARSQITLTDTLYKFLLPWESLVTYFAPDFFGHPATQNFFRGGSAQYYEGIMFVGVAALVFAVYAICHSRLDRESRALDSHQFTLSLSKGGNDKLVVFLTIASVISLLTTLDWFGAKIFLSLPIPFLSSSIPNRVLFIPAFCLALLASLGFEKWLTEKNRSILKILMGFAGIYSGLVFMLLIVKIFHLTYFRYSSFTSGQNVMVSLRNLLIPIGVFGLCSILIVVGITKETLKNKAAILIIVMAFFSTFLFAKKYMSFTGRQYIFPDIPVLNYIKQNQGIDRTWGLGDAYLETNLATQYGIYFPEGYDSLNNRSYGEFTFVMQGAKLSDYVFRADAGLGRASTAELLGNESRRKLIDILGIKYLIVKREDFDKVGKSNFEKVFEDSSYGVFENNQVMPRVFLASNYEGPPDIIVPPTESESEKALREKERRKLIPQKLLSADFDYRNVLVLEQPSPVSPQFGEGTVDIVKYDPQEVVIRTKSEQPKLLFISDNYYPGWKAKVDGDETEILRADYTFRAIPLTPGGHEVRFYFDSQSYKTGLMISLTALGVVLLLTSGKNPLVG